MKNTLLFFSAISISLNLCAQSSIAISRASTSVSIPANTVIQSGTTESDLTTITIDIKNVSAVTHTYNVKRYDIVLNIVAPGDTALPNFCFATQCYGKDTKVSPMPLVLGAGMAASQSTVSFTMLDADLIEATKKGYTYVKYTFFEANNPTDSLQFSIKYNESLKTGIYESNQNFSGISLFPNPAKRQTNLAVTAIKEGIAEIKIVNLIGETVFEKEVSLVQGKNSLALNIQDFPAGLYFVQCRSGEQSSSKRLIID